MLSTVVKTRSRVQQELAEVRTHAAPPLHRASQPVERFVSGGSSPRAPADVVPLRDGSAAFRRRFAGARLPWCGEDHPTPATHAPFRAPGG